MFKRVNNGVIVGWWEGSSAEVPSHHPPGQPPSPPWLALRQVSASVVVCVQSYTSFTFPVYLKVYHSIVAYFSEIISVCLSLYSSQSTRRWLRLLLLPHYPIILNVNIFDWHKSTIYIQFCIRHKVPTLLIISGARIVFYQIPPRFRPSGSPSSDVIFM